MRKYIKSRYSSFTYALKGLRILLTTQPNFVIHIVSGVLVTLAGFYFHISPGEWVAVVLTIIIVLLTEVFNTAIEFIVDLVSPEYHPIAGKIKDISAAAVLLSAIGAVVIGLIVFGPRVWALLKF
jgi:diacylglycerol kinase